MTKKSFVWQTRVTKQEKRILAYSASGYVTEIDFARVEKKHRVSREC